MLGDSCGKEWHSEETVESLFEGRMSSPDFNDSKSYLHINKTRPSSNVAIGPGVGEKGLAI